MSRKFGLLLKDIHEYQYRFQTRNPYANPLRQIHQRKKQFAQQLEELVSFLKDNPGQPLEPLKVWQDPLNDNYYVVDGHHRLEAYKEAKWRRNKKVPCVLIEADTDHQALSKVFKENSRGKLGYTNAERVEAAWVERCRLERQGTTPSVKEIKETFGISAGTASNFNQAILKLKRKNGGEIPKRVAHWKTLSKPLPEYDLLEMTEGTGAHTTRVANDLAENFTRYDLETQELIAVKLSERINDHLMSCGEAGEGKRWRMFLEDDEEEDF